MKSATQEKKRWLAMLTLTILAVVIAFLWLFNRGQPPAMRGLLDITLGILGVSAAAIILFFIFWGDFFADGDQMQGNQITLVITAVICIIQITLAFATYSLKQLEFENNSLQKAKATFSEMAAVGLDPFFGAPAAALPEELAAVHQLDADGLVINSTDHRLVGQKITVDPLKSYRFPNEKFTVVMDISETYERNMVSRLLLDLLTVLVASIILTMELIFFMVKFLEDRFHGATAATRAGDNAGYRLVGYVRHIAFLFFFSSRLTVTLIAMIAVDLGGTLLGLDGSVLAGIPLSAEFLLTCVAIFATSALIEKRGWKLPFAGGALIVAAGTLLSALADSIALFILARAVVGLGYGFCWMTLRNFALFAADEAERSHCFARLNAGIYAGINAGAVLGAVMADIIGYAPVLVLSSALTLGCTLLVSGFQNTTSHPPASHREAPDAAAGERKTRTAAPGKAHRHELLEVAGFILLMTLPSCILGSYIGYYLPIYFSSIGKAASDVGRAQLIYGMIIVFIGPHLVGALNRHRHLIGWNLAYNALFSVALIGFGLLGGFPTAILVVIVLGLADSFGFVAQNNHFLNLAYVRRLGESRALSYVSLVKKMAEMLGPIAFGLTLHFGGFEGVAVLGVLFLIAAVAYLPLCSATRPAQAPTSKTCNT